MGPQNPRYARFVEDHRAVAVVIAGRPMVLRPRHVVPREGYQSIGPSVMRDRMSVDHSAGTRNREEHLRALSASGERAFEESGDPRDDEVRKAKIDLGVTIESSRNETEK
ncbi:hypothetical protein DEU56DRAFT_755798 [Suillus clintonianus]|uniref:uncharacterized protein n=1 Tax=Suillus clintonianus TaxID=1904413 RepID=UPI001B877447|nr:uncharacterized protein DEU56DRAFT_755798 [Suillus clintonianus]KAG2138497.1 hypothetical protein DEU56DRAFT_755798 [Suillus clintonianus]